MFADSSEFLDEVPNDLLPMEMRDAPKPEKLSSEQAEKLVRDHLGFTGDTEISVVHDHDNDQQHYIFQVYKIFDKGTQFEHNSTYGWYRVNPNTGEIADAMLEGF